MGSKQKNVNNCFTYNAINEDRMDFNYFVSAF